MTTYWRLSGSISESLGWTELPAHAHKEAAAMWSALFANASVYSVCALRIKTYVYKAENHHRHELLFRQNITEHVMLEEVSAYFIDKQSHHKVCSIAVGELSPPRLMELSLNCRCLKFAIDFWFLSSQTETIMPTWRQRCHFFGLVQATLWGM